VHREDGCRVPAIGGCGNGKAPMGRFVRMANGWGICGKSTIIRDGSLLGLGVYERASAGAEHEECDNGHDTDDDEYKECNEEVDHCGRQVCCLTPIAVANLEGGHSGGGCFARGMQRATVVVSVCFVGVVDRHDGQFEAGELSLYCWGCRVRSGLQRLIKVAVG